MRARGVRLRHWAGFAVTLTVMTAVTLGFLTGGTPPRATAGVEIYNKPFCGANEWVRVKLPQSEFTIHDSAGTCISAERSHLYFTVDKITRNIAWQYPNIASGYEVGNSCASVKDTCFKYPVEQRDDGTPVADVAAWIASGTQDLAFDIWFTPDASHTAYDQKTGDTEIMVWLAHPGINDRSHYIRYADIDGQRWGVMSWTAENQGQKWTYVAFLAPRDTGGRYERDDVWLNPFFRNAEEYGELRSDEYLISVDLGFEIVSGGTHDNIHQYSLTGVK